MHIDERSYEVCMYAQIRRRITTQTEALLPGPPNAMFTRKIPKQSGASAWRPQQIHLAEEEVELKENRKEKAQKRVKFTL
jgi:hypothetical protein